MKELQSTLKKQERSIREKDDLIEQLKGAQVPPQLNKKDVKEAMQSIIKMEVEQRTKAWIASQQGPTSNQSSVQQLQKAITQMQRDKDTVEVQTKMRVKTVEKDLTEATDQLMYQVTQVRTPDELQNIYKELLGLKNHVA